MPTDQCTPIYDYEFGPTGLIGSNVFMDANDDGLLSRTARADKGDGVLFYDADGDGAISGEARFTRSDGSTGIVADMSLATDSESYRVVEGTTISGDIRTTVTLIFNADGKLASNIAGHPHIQSRCCLGQRVTRD